MGQQQQAEIINNAVMQAMSIYFGQMQQGQQGQPMGASPVPPVPPVPQPMQQQ